MHQCYFVSVPSFIVAAVILTNCNQPPPTNTRTHVRFFARKSKKNAIITEFPATVKTGRRGVRVCHKRTRVLHVVTYHG